MNQSITKTTYKQTKFITLKKAPQLDQEFLKDLQRLLDRLSRHDTEGILLIFFNQYHPFNINLNQSISRQFNIQSGELQRFSFQQRGRRYEKIQKIFQILRQQDRGFMKQLKLVSIQEIFKLIKTWYIPFFYNPYKDNFWRNQDAMQKILKNISSINFLRLTSLKLPDAYIDNIQPLSWLNSPQLNKLNLSNNFISKCRPLIKGTLDCLYSLQLAQNRFTQDNIRHFSRCKIKVQKCKYSQLKTQPGRFHQLILTQSNTSSKQQKHKFQGFILQLPILYGNKSYDPKLSDKMIPCITDIVKFQPQYITSLQHSVNFHIPERLSHMLQQRFDDKYIIKDLQSQNA